MQPNQSSKSPKYPYQAKEKYYFGMKHRLSESVCFQSSKVESPKIQKIQSFYGFKKAKIDPNTNVQPSNKLQNPQIVTRQTNNLQARYCPAQYMLRGQNGVNQKTIQTILKILQFLNSCDEKKLIQLQNIRVQSLNHLQLQKSFRTLIQKINAKTQQLAKTRKTIQEIQRQTKTNKQQVAKTKVLFQEKQKEIKQYSILLGNLNKKIQEYKRQNAQLRQKIETDKDKNIAINENNKKIIIQQATKKINSKSSLLQQAIKIKEKLLDDQKFLKKGFLVDSKIIQNLQMKKQLVKALQKCLRSNVSKSSLKYQLIQNLRPSNTQLSSFRNILLLIKTQSNGIIGGFSKLCRGELQPSFIFKVNAAQNRKNVSNLQIFPIKEKKSSINLSNQQFFNFGNSQLSLDYSNKIVFSEIVQDKLGYFRTQGIGAAQFLGVRKDSTVRSKVKVINFQIYSIAIEGQNEYLSEDQLIQRGIVKAKKQITEKTKILELQRLQSKQMSQSFCENQNKVRTQKSQQKYGGEIPRVVRQLSAIDLTYRSGQMNKLKMENEMLKERLIQAANFFQNTMTQLVYGRPMACQLSSSRSMRSSMVIPQQEVQRSNIN